MKAVIIKARDKFKVGDVIECTGDEFSVLAADGIAVTESEHAVSAALRATERNTIQAAVVRAQARKAIAPKDETVSARMFERFDKGQASAEVLVEMIDGLQSQEEKDLTVRTTQFRDDANGVLRGERLQFQGVDPKDAAVKACDLKKPIDGLIRAGKIKEAMALSRESSVIMASDLMPIVNKGGDFMLKDIVRAADTTDANVGTIATGLVLMRNLGYLKNIINFMPYISTDFRNEPALYGQPVFSRYIVPPGVTAFNTTTGWGDSTPSTVDCSVTINKHNGVQITFETQLLGSTVRNLLTEQVSAQTYALGEQVVKDFLNTLFAATWTGTVNNVSLGNNFNLSSFVTLKNRATLAKLPPVGRFALMHSTYHDGVLTDGNLVTAKAIMSLINKDISALESAELPTLYGIKPLESQLASAIDDGTLTAPAISADGTVSFAGVTKVGFMGNMSSMLMAARVPQDYTQAFKDIPATAAVEIVTDPDSGLSMLNCRYVNHQLARVTNRLSLMYGFAQGDPRQGIVLKP